MIADTFDFRETARSHVDYLSRGGCDATRRDAGGGALNGPARTLGFVPHARKSEQCGSLKLFTREHALLRHNNSEGGPEELLSPENLSLLRSAIHASFIRDKNVES